MTRKVWLLIDGKAVETLFEYYNNLLCTPSETEMLLLEEHQGCTVVIEGTVNHILYEVTLLDQPTYTPEMGWTVPIWYEEHDIVEDLSYA